MSYLETRQQQPNDIKGLFSEKMAPPLESRLSHGLTPCFPYEPTPLLYPLDIIVLFHPMQYLHTSYLFDIVLLIGGYRKWNNDIIGS